MGGVTSFISNINFYEIIEALFNSKIYEYVFPFFLMYSICFIILGNINIFKNKDKSPKKSIIVIVSLIVSFFGATFEVSPGFTVGKYLMMLFPNVSALTVLLLGLYVVGSLFGKNFFGDFFKSPTYSAFIFYAVGAIGLGAVLYYLAIAMGFIDYSTVSSQLFYWNFIIGVGFIILGVVFLFTGSISVGLILLTVTIYFFFHFSEEKFILLYFFDPFIFMWSIILLLISWMQSDNDMKKGLLKELKEKEDFIKEYEKKLKKGRGEIDPYKHRIFGQVLESKEKLEKKLKKLNK